MTFSKKTRWALLAIGISLALFVGPFALLVAGNAGGAVLDLVLNRKPTREELLGKYTLKVDWGDSDLEISPDQTFREEIRPKGSPARVVSGTWQANDNGNVLNVDFQPFGMVWDDDHDSDTSYFTIQFRKPHFGVTYGLVDDDLGEAFKREQGDHHAVK